MPKLIPEPKEKLIQVFLQVFFFFYCISSLLSTGGERKSWNRLERQHMQDRRIPIIPVTHPRLLSGIPGFYAASGEYRRNLILFEALRMAEPELAQENVVSRNILLNPLFHVINGLINYTSSTDLKWFSGSAP